jgi:hypothetical protein
MHMPDVKFIPLGQLGGSDEGATTLDYARSRGRWQALPDGWLSAKDMREALKQVCRIPEWDNGAAEAALWAMSDFLEARGNGADRMYRRVETPPTPMTPAAIMQAETARRAEVEREQHERELQTRISVNAEKDKVFFDNQRRVHQELALEFTVPMIRALEARIAELEGQRAQHGELEAAAVSTATATATASEASDESIRARARRFMFGDATPDEIERLLEQAEADGEDSE